MLPRHFSSFIPIFLLCFAGFNAGENPNSDLELHFTRVGRDRRGRYVKNKVEVIKRNVEFDDWVARGYFENKVNVTGFGYLEVETNGNADSALQAYHAGFLEGFLTADLIYARWFNTLNVLCRDQPTDCELVENFVKRNSKWLSRRLKRLSADPYWYQVKLFYLQVNGVLDGYNSKTKHEKLSWDDILAMNMLLEFGDILQMAKGAKSRKFDNDHCSALIKVMPDNSDIYFGHNTWYDYMEMLRILKKYNLNYAKSQSDAALIPGRQMSFSSYPAAVQSIDDYYLIASSGLAVMETTNEVFNLTLFKDAHPFGKVFEAVRSMVANRLAVDGETWFKTFVQFNSGTYNNQWMVLDYNKIEARLKFGHGPDVLWVGEQLPGYYVFEDVTRILFSNGYWASYNIPYFREVYEKSGYEEAVNANGTWYSYTEAPRARIFARDQETVKDMDSFMTLLRSNNFEHEPFARCNCTPPYSAAGAIAARRDLNPVDGQNEQVCKPYGAIDAKITNRSMFRRYAFQAVAGPTRGTNGELPVFKWSESRFGKDAHHLLQPDVFDFAPVNVEWKLGGISRGLDEKNEYMVVGSGVDYSGLQGVFAGDDNNIPID